MTTMTKGFISDRTLAERLEVFEDNLRLQDEIAAAKDKLKQQEERHAVAIGTMRREAGDPIQTAIDILQSHQLSETMRHDAERQRDLFGAENDELRAQLGESTSTIATLRDQVTHYKGQCEALLAKHNSEVQKAQAALDVQARQLAGVTVELKDLRGLNPQRLQKQVKELQKKNKDLVEGNVQLRKLANDNQKIRKEHEERGRVIDKLYSDNRRLDAALAEACDQMNTNAKLQPIESHGDWEIYGHNDGTEALILHHVPTDSSRVYWARSGFKKLPALPAKLKARAEEMISNYVTTRDGMVDYAGGERVEVA